MTPQARRWVWRLLGIAGLGFMVAVVWRELASGAVVVWPRWWALVGSFILVMFGLALSSSAWIRLLGESGDARLHRADFFSAQLGKYLPGGIWQPLGQVGLANERGVSKVRSSTAVILHAAIQVAAGAFLALPLVFRSELAIPVRVVAAAGVLVPFLLTPALGRLGRSPRVPVSAGDLVSTSRPGGTFALLAVNLVVQGLAFSLLASVEGFDVVWTTVAFSVGWTLGFLAIPFPAGLGVREAVLVALMPVPAATVVTASVVLRIVAIGAEFTSIIVTRRRG